MQTGTAPGALYPEELFKLLNLQEEKTSSGSSGGTLDLRPEDLPDGRPPLEATVKVTRRSPTSGAVRQVLWTFDQRTCLIEDIL